jgi:pimeloyl-ACP methyl ester carboxylesterase
VPGPVTERIVDVDGVRVFVRSSEGEGPPVVFSHGHPTDSSDWIPFMEALARPAIAFDLPGWGRSGRPSTREFDYSMGGMARFFGRVLDWLGVGECALLVHDWGVLALIDAIRRAERVERLVVMNTVPLLPGYRWHRLAVTWRAPVAGRVLNRAVRWRAVQALMKRGDPEGRRLPDAAISRILNSWASTSSAATIELYRSGGPDALAAAGTGLGRLGCPALVVWGMLDPYLPGRFARAYAERLPNVAEVIELPDAGHWPWIEQPGLIDRVVGFLDAGGS